MIAAEAVAAAGRRLVEAVMGFPGVMLESLLAQVERLRAKAIPASRDKGALTALRAQAQGQ